MTVEELIERLRELPPEAQKLPVTMARADEDIGTVYDEMQPGDVEEAAPGAWFMRFKPVRKMLVAEEVAGPHVRIG